MEIIFIISVIVIVLILIISSQKNSQKEKVQLLSSIKNIKNKFEINKLTTFVEKEDGNYAIVGKDSIIELDSNLAGTMVYNCTSNNSFVIVFKNKIGIIKIKNFMTSSTDIYYINSENIETLDIETIYKQKIETKKSGSRVLRASAGAALTGSLTGAALGAMSVSKQTIQSEEYAGTKLSIFLKKINGDWFAKKDEIIFIEPTDAIKLEAEIKKIL